MRAFYLTSFAVLGLAACSVGGEVEVDPSGPVVTAADFEIINGDSWTGNLTYLDYGSDKRVTIPATATVKAVSPTTLKYSISYPEEPWEDTKAKLKRSKSGRLLDGHVVTSRNTQSNGTVEITTLHRGEDNNQPADIRLTYVLSFGNFSIKKDVRFAEGEDFTNRNIYSFNRDFGLTGIRD